MSLCIGFICSNAFEQETQKELIEIYYKLNLRGLALKLAPLFFSSSIFMH